MSTRVAVYFASYMALHWASNSAFSWAICAFNSAAISTLIWARIVSVLGSMLRRVQTNKVSVNVVVKWSNVYISGGVW